MAPVPEVSGSSPSEGRCPSPTTLVLDTRKDRQVRQRVAAERVRREAAVGLRPAPEDHFRRLPERPFATAQRAETTILLGGLTRLHDVLIEATFLGAGYHCERLPVPDLACFHLGREFCDNGLCSPAYFNVGTLVGYLQHLEAGGLTRQEIVDHYVFFTAGGNGPCRFGMYESEYRLALDNAGFEGFRVLTFQQGISRGPDGTSGLVISLGHALGILKAFHVADVLNHIVHRLRPYETVPGATDRALAECEADVYAHLRSAVVHEWHEGLARWLVAAVGSRKWLRELVNVVSKYRQLLAGPEYRDLLRRCGARFDRVELDRTRVKPVVKITGEFWAQTTEGDGNYRMFDFLEREGAEVLVEPFASWVTYLVFSGRLRYLERRRSASRLERRPSKRLVGALATRARLWLFDLAERLFTRELERAVRNVGAPGPHLVAQDILADAARPYYDPRARGGEGHLEVAKNIHYTAGRRCHMVLSLKPFGCLPSSQSDGVQAAVVDRYPEMIFLPVETSGEGEVQAHSRVQMSLSDARAAARAEFDAALEATSLSVDRLQDFIATRPELRRGLYNVPSRSGVAGQAATFVYHVRELMDRDGGFRRPGRGRGRAAAGCRPVLPETLG